MSRIDFRAGAELRASILEDDLNDDWDRIGLSSRGVVLGGDVRSIAASIQE